MADGSARVPEVLSAAELEGFFAGFVTEPLEPALGASMGEDVEEAQEPGFATSTVFTFSTDVSINYDLERTGRIIWKI